MPQYFMSDTRLGWLEKMMMDPSRRPPARAAPQQKGPRKKPSHSQSAKPNSHEWELKEGGV